MIRYDFHQFFSFYFRLKKKVIDLEIQLIRANERIVILEEKLEQKKVDWIAALKKTKSFKDQLEQLRNRPSIHSNSLNVSLVRFYRVFI